MRKTNLVLLAILVLLLGFGAYFLLGASLKAETAVTATPAGYRCELTLNNGSLFPCEYLEFIAVSPEGAYVEDAEGAGGTVSALSRARASFVIPSDVPLPCTVEVGYYVWGRRKTVSVTVK